MRKGLNTIDVASLLYCSVCSKSEIIRYVSRGFSYPSRDVFLSICSTESFDALRELLSEKFFESKPNITAFDGFFSYVSNLPLDELLSELRQEYTRLFITPPVQIPLCGAAWNSVSEVSKKCGEHHAVRQCCQVLNLKNKSDVTDRYDSLVSELDYVAYVTHHEAQAWKGDDPLSAHDWHELLEFFLHNHAHRFACGVSRAIQEKTSNPYYCFFARLLDVYIVDKIDCTHCEYL